MSKKITHAIIMYIYIQHIFLILIKHVLVKLYQLLFQWFNRSLMVAGGAFHTTILTIALCKINGLFVPLDAYCYITTSLLVQRDFQTIVKLSNF